MLLIFRLFFFAIGLAVLAVALLARGLVPEPAFHTRIGEVPSLSRPLMQQAIIVPTQWERRFLTSVGRQTRGPEDAPEPTELAETIPPAPAGAQASAATRAHETSRAVYVSPVIWSRVPRPDPLIELKQAARAGTPELTLPSRQIVGIVRGRAAVEPPALAFGIDEPASEDGADAGAAGHNAEAQKPAAKRQAKAETGPEATAEAKAEARAKPKAAKPAKAAIARPAKASKPKYRRKSVRRGRTTKARKRKVAARSVVRSTRKKARRARSAQRERARKRVRTSPRKARSAVARRTTRTLNQATLRQPADGVYRFERPRSYRNYLAPQFRAYRTNSR